MDNLSIMQTFYVNELKIYSIYAYIEIEKKMYCPENLKNIKVVVPF